jgi:hypothetical protein
VSGHKAVGHLTWLKEIGRKVGSVGEVLRSENPGSTHRLKNFGRYLSSDFEAI